MKDIAVVAYCRTGIAKATRGALNQTHGIPLTAHVLRHAVNRAGVDPAEIEDVVVGCGLPEGATGHNIARNAALEAGFGDAVPGMTVNRYCGSGLSAASIVANRINAGEATIAIAAGTVPPSMTNSVTVIEAARGEARNATSSATSRSARSSDRDAPERVHQSLASALVVSARLVGQLVDQADSGFRLHPTRRHSNHTDAKFHGEGAGEPARGRAVSRLTVGRHVSRVGCGDSREDS